MDTSFARSTRDTLKLTGTVLLVLTLVLLLRSGLQTRLAAGGLSEMVARDLSYLIVPPLLALMLAPVARDAFRGIGAKLRVDDLGLRTVVLAIALGVALRLVYWGALLAGVSFRVIANPDPGAPVGPSLAFACPPAPRIALNLFVMTLLTPVVEEVVHRAGITEWLLRFGRCFAIVGSAVVFAAFHKSESMAYALIFGLLVGALYLNSRSLWGPFIAHATANGLIVLDWLCLKGTWNPVAVTDGSVGVGLLASALAATALGLAALLVSRRIAGREPDDPPGRGFPT